MKGARPLTDAEVSMIENSFSGTFANRDKAMFVLGVRTGFRLSELLSLTIGDVQQDGKIVDRVTVSKRNPKGRREGRTIILHPSAREALAVWLQELNGYPSDTCLFHSRKGGNKAITKRGAGLILRQALRATNLHHKGMGTHCMRKTFAKRIYVKSGENLLKTQALLGHKNINSTVSYLEVDQQDADELVLSC